MRNGTHNAHTRPAGGARVACTAGLTLALALNCALSAPSAAAAASAQTESDLARLTAEVDDAASAYAEATARAEKLDAQAAEIAEEILSIEQDRMPAQQERAARAARDLYKEQAGGANIIAKLLSTGSISDFFAMNKYLTAIQDEQVGALEDLNRLDDDLNAKLDEMSRAKDDAEAAQGQASDALARAKAAAAKIQQKADAENAAEAEAARQAAAKAAALAAQESAGWKGSTGTGATESETPAAGQGEASQTPSGGSQGDQSDTGSDGQSGSTGGASGSTAQGGWKSGKASYYGIGDGFLGGTTASGAPVTETSMGVAMLNVPLGTRVEIRFRGRTVVAVVNDRGPYAHGRVIDMQPAVARALDFVSVGVGTVEYRFL